MSSCGNLGIDESCIVVQSNVSYGIRFLYQSMECDNCSLLQLNPLGPFKSQKKILKFASLGTVWQVVDEENKTICSKSHNYLGENSSYHIIVNDKNCSLVCEKEPEAVYIPILIAIGIYFLLAVIWMLGKFIYRTEVINRLLHRDSMDVSVDLTAAYSSTSSINDSKKQKPVQRRLRSLDTVRGIAIVIMIFVNYGGGKYSFFHHSRWNGLTIADVVFPWFIWMMGMSMAMSLRSLLRKSVPRKKIFLKIVKRSIILFALGLMLNTYCRTVNLAELRIPGVLQRFSISYFVVATVHLFYASPEDIDQMSSLSPYRDLVPYGGEWLIMLTFLAIHILLMFFIHGPNCPPGYFGPGGMHDGGMYSQCTGGAAGYVDRVLLGNSHIYQKPSFKTIYHSTQPYDPEGILGFFTSIFLVFLGLQAGKILLTYKEWKARVIRWMFWAVITGIIAAILCLGSKNGGWIPVNKNLWSVSYILATGSMAFTLLSICYFVIDIKNWWSGAPFYHAGMNSIMLYVGHSITHQMFPWRWQVEPSHMNELFMNLWGTTLWVITAIWMHHKSIFVTV
ncbi:heparan-alpha-glucosaminide N-acetyltransferase-like isoform X2 [Stegodyphus dumicola]|uniref:heparan-alpha-glucosaminide N-acetyltransferase-like isoform X2 n=1 Tax=Stegodyphus dumicola TaxID=202533 RepID=UPI0015A95EC7|nr:heparan-alpha-glucosaminide N-acetyltransferase-like isoform X2 [Stegodyphus dumicola]